MEVERLHKLERLEYLVVFQYCSSKELSKFIFINKYCKDSIERITKYTTNSVNLLYLMDKYPLLRKINCRLSCLPTKTALPEYIDLSVSADSPYHKNIIVIHSNNIIDFQVKDTDTYLPLPFMPKLQILTIRFTQKVIQSLSQILQQIPQLKKIVITSVSTEYFSEINVLRSVSQLQEIYIEFLEMKKDSLKPFISTLSSFGPQIKIVITIHMNMFEALSYEHIDSVLDSPKNFTIYFYNVDLRDNSKRDIWEYIMSKVYAEPFRFFLSFTPTKFPCFNQNMMDFFITAYLPDFPTMVIQKRIEDNINSLKLYNSVEFTRLPKTLDICSSLKRVFLHPIYGDKTKRDYIDLNLVNCPSLESLETEGLDIFQFHLGSHLKYLSIMRGKVPQLIDLKENTNIETLTLVELEINTLLLPKTLKTLKVVSCQIHSFNLEELDGLKSLHWKYLDFIFICPKNIESIKLSKVKFVRETNFAMYTQLKNLTFQKISSIEYFNLPTSVECISLDSLIILKSLPSLKEMKLLTCLEIEQCPQLSSLAIPSNLLKLKLKNTQIDQLIAFCGNECGPQLSTIECNNMDFLPQFQFFTQLKEIVLEECQINDQILFPRSILSFSGINCILQSLDFSNCLQLKQLSNFNVYCKSIQISPSVEALKLTYLSSLIAEINETSHLTNITRLELSYVNLSKIDFSPLTRLESIDFRGVSYSTLKLPQSLKSAQFKFMTSTDCALELQELTQLQSIEIISFSPYEYSFPISLKSLVIKHSPKFIVNLNKFTVLTKLTQLIIVDIPITQPFLIDDFSFVEMFSFRPNE
ncbi:leucine rich repeatcontaining protein [Entamoeba histolytica KU27]|uniref:Leucine rich repeatcontaining protein n=1 Tax=Entamoeba histolytica KU27 TaxID=885311 RepID=M2QGX3_ENTHI|nr:leucine rich repeatcontaining protein [Entamoeba histolytica KU27]